MSIDGVIPTIFPHKEQKEDQENETMAHVFSCEFFAVFKKTCF